MARAVQHRVGARSGAAGWPDREALATGAPRLGTPRCCTGELHPRCSGQSSVSASPTARSSKIRTTHLVRSVAALHCLDRSAARSPRPVCPRAQRSAARGRQACGHDVVHKGARPDRGRARCGTSPAPTCTLHCEPGKASDGKFGCSRTAPPGDRGCAKCGLGHDDAVAPLPEPRHGV
jgi:hypothetical protein